MTVAIPGHPSDRSLREGADWAPAIDEARAASWRKTKEQIHSAIMRARQIDEADETAQP